MTTAGEGPLLSAEAAMLDTATLGPRIEPFEDLLQEPHEARDPVGLREDGSGGADAPGASNEKPGALGAPQASSSEGPIARSFQKPGASGMPQSASSERPVPRSLQKAGASGAPQIASSVQSLVSRAPQTASSEGPGSGGEDSSSMEPKENGLLSDPLQIHAFSQGEATAREREDPSSREPSLEEPKASPRQADDPLLSTARGSGSHSEEAPPDPTPESCVPASPASQHEGSGYLEQDAELYQDYLDKVMVADMEDVLLHEDEGPRPSTSQGPRTGRATWPARHSASPAAHHRGGGLQSQAEEGEARYAGSVEGTSQGQGLRLVEAEVVAFRLVPGQVALGDRLVGVRAHAEYNVRVTASDGRVWMVQRRYREFMDLHWELVRFLERAQPPQHQGSGPHVQQQVPGTLLLPREWSEAWKDGGQLVGTSSTRTVERRRQLLHNCLAATLAAGPPLSEAPALVRFLVEDPMVHSPATGGLVRPQIGDALPARAGGAGISALGASLGQLQHWLRGPGGLLPAPAAPLAPLAGSGAGSGGAPASAKQDEVDLGASPATAKQKEGDVDGREVPGAEANTGLPALHQRMHLVLQLHPLLFPDARLMLRQLSTQRYACASCSRPLEEPSPEQSLRAPLGLQAALQPFQPRQALQSEASPRLCHYLGRLFCGACQPGDTAVLPALVLHRWDFTRRPVCQHSQAYLDSIADQPILCVAAVNPLLFQRCPALGHLNALRSQVALLFRALPPACPARAKSRHALGRRSYVLDPGSEGFYAMRELEDVAKGPFALVPDLLRQLLRRLRAHIEGGLCGACQGAGVDLCAAGTHCSHNSCALITRDPAGGEPPVRCPSCHAAYHPRCLPRLQRCAKCRSHALMDSQRVHPSNGHGTGEGGEESPGSEGSGPSGTPLAGRKGSRGGSGSSSGSIRKSGSWFGGWGTADSPVLQMHPMSGDPEG